MLKSITISQRIIGTGITQIVKFIMSNPSMLEIGKESAQELRNLANTV